jgi:transposase
MRPKGTAAALEARRLIAADLLRQEKTLAEIAQLLGVDISSVKRWKKAFRRDGLAGLAAKPHPGPRPKLCEEQQHQLCDRLVLGARAVGYDTDLWTCRRVTALIQEQFGVSYHFNHVGRLLHDLGFGPQKPLRRARERDEAAIQRWRKHDWPRIKKRDDDFKPASYFSTKPAFFCSR